MIKIILFIFLILFIFILFSPIIIHFNYSKDKYNLTFKTFFLFNKNISLNKYIKKKINENEKVSVDKIIKYYKVYDQTKKVFLFILKTISIESIEYVYNCPFSKTQKIILSELLWTYINNFISFNFKECIYKKYILKFEEEESINFDIKFRLYFYKLIIIIIKNLNKIIKSVNILKEEKNNESPN